VKYVLFTNTCKLHNYNVFLQMILLNFFMHVQIMHITTICLIYNNIYVNKINIEIDFTNTILIYSNIYVNQFQYICTNTTVAILVYKN
jgi:hypothetical protein